MIGGNDRHLYLAAAVVLLGTGIVAWSGAEPARAQTSAGRADAPASVQWQLRVDGADADWPVARPQAPLDSVQAVARQTVRQFRRDGYYYARLDSATVHRTATPVRATLYVDRGPRIALGRIRIRGASVVPKSVIRERLAIEPGRPLDAERLEAGLDAVLHAHEEAGHPMAAVRVDSLHRTDASPPRLVLTLRVDAGPTLRLQRIAVPEGARTTPDFIAGVTSLRRGMPVTDYDPEAVRRALRATGLFQSVDAPELRVMPDSSAVLFVPLEERNPGSFDLVLGYLPPSGPRGAGQVVGAGHLRLRNVFGEGRKATVQLDRRPDQASQVDLSVTDPYLLGRPLRVHASFQGEQRDSTYSRRALRVEGGYRFDSGWAVSGTMSREGTTPGFAGTALQNGQQAIARSTSWFYGVGLRYDGRDDRVNPRRGARLDVSIEQGRTDRRLQRVVGPDTTTQNESLRRERLRASGRAYVPLFDRQVFVVGGEASALFSDAFDASDLFRIGGATSLRGYDEDRFRGNVVGRMLAEYRVQIDPVSYAYAFTDLGVVHRPTTPERRAGTGWHPGFGVGMQVRTAVGIVTFTYALNPDALRPSDGKIHIGLSFDL